MTIGVFLDEYEPAIGGGFTFTDTVFKAFLNTVGGSKHRFVIFCSPSARQMLSSRPIPAEIKLIAFPTRSAWLHLITIIKHFFPVTVPMLHSFSKLRRVARREGVQVIWFMGDRTYDTLDLPYIATVWDLQHRTHPWFPEVSAEGRWEYREIFRARYLRRAMHIITGTEAGKDQLSWYYQVHPELISIIPHPVPEYEEIPIRAGAEPFTDTRFLAKPFFLYPAQFWAHKNHVNLLYALKELKEEHALEVHLVFTGSDKGNSQHVMEVATRLGLSKHVFNMGFVSRDQSEFLYNNATALAYLSFSGPENLPPLEAFSKGCPVINSRFPGAEEQLGQAAILVDPKDPADIAGAMKEVLMSPDKREKMKQLGRDQLARRSGADFVARALRIFDNLEPIRRAWP
jgi:glycosyltransferase involved in cell wall biosynthesis